jgi:hypothetical protein
MIKMTNQTFKKKSFNTGPQDDTSNPRTATPIATEKSDGNKSSKTDSAAKKETTRADSDEGTIRLSCDLPRRLHKTLRVGAALSERSILGMIEVLITKHLSDRPADQIIADYSKNNDTNR